MVNAVSFLNLSIDDPYKMRDTKGLGAESAGAKPIGDAPPPKDKKSDFDFMDSVKPSHKDKPDDNVELLDTALDMESIDEMLKLQQEQHAF